MTSLFQDNHDLEGCKGPAELQLGEAAIQPLRMQAWLPSEVFSAEYTLAIGIQSLEVDVLSHFIVKNVRMLYISFNSKRKTLQWAYPTAHVHSGCKNKYFYLWILFSALKQAVSIKLSDRAVRYIAHSG